MSETQMITRSSLSAMTLEHEAVELCTALLGCPTTRCSARFARHAPANVGQPLKVWFEELSVL